jgi:hypothetical protein
MGKGDFLFRRLKWSPIHFEFLCSHGVFDSMDIFTEVKMIPQVGWIYLCSFPRRIDSNLTPFPPNFLYTTHTHIHITDNKFAMISFKFLPWALIALPVLAQGPPPAPVQAGHLATCFTWHKAVEGDTCYSLAKDFGISMVEFEFLNPPLRDDCSANLWAGYWYCVRPPSIDGPLASVTTTTTDLQDPVTRTMTQLVTPVPPQRYACPQSTDRCVAGVLSATANVDSGAAQMSWCGELLRTDAPPDWPVTSLWRNVPGMQSYALLQSACEYEVAVSTDVARASVVFEESPPAASMISEGCSCLHEWKTMAR